MLKKNLLSAEAAVNAASAAAIAGIALTQVRIVRTRSIVHSPSILAAPNHTECVRCDLGECHNVMWMPAIGPWSIGTLVQYSMRVLKKDGDSLAGCEALDAFHRGHAITSNSAF